ncbi:hypothetical protein QRN89_10395 [Streptomyces chengbuensis]|uniref:hypothetical protein n=1 Tax=Streptomyces TaxID=1883 RepID=UPI0025B5D98E|nr:hypothetical protein [Streptomyces sp. HUAS CB01]WJY50195.1 hypothetical protein QRN89_10395 [Streptomyces sp. HUAS CB01]
MADKQLIEHLRARPGIYGLNGTYHPTAMLLLGFDLARDGGLLRGFREWLVVRKGEPSSAVWYALVFQESLPGVSLRNWGRLEPEQDQRAVDHLFSLVLEFLDVRDDSDSLARMYAKYQSLQIGR